MGADVADMRSKDGEVVPHVPEGRDDVAIVGMACMYPGAPDLQTYWRNITSKVDAITDPPSDVWDVDVFYDPKATTVTTQVAEVLRERRGVCQDFAHLMMSCLRSLGLSARYVSGYVVNRASAEKRRMAGADASHAWVSAYCPGLGWVDYDPTNGKQANLEFITLGWGREFSDVSPLRGVVLGTGTQTLTVAVKVRQV